MTAYRAIVLTVLAMVAFAGNSLLCRAALKATQIDAATFTTIRIASGALALWLIVRMRETSNGAWRRVSRMIVGSEATKAFREL